MAPARPRLLGHEAGQFFTKFRTRRNTSVTPLSYSAHHLRISRVSHTALTARLQSPSAVAGQPLRVPKDPKAADARVVLNSSNSSETAGSPLRDHLLPLLLVLLLFGGVLGPAAILLEDPFTPRVGCFAALLTEKFGG
eukprot:330436-Pyramimonas_sp.AAC.1